MRYTNHIGELTQDIEVRPRAGGKLDVAIGDRTVQVEVRGATAAAVDAGDASRLTLIVDGRPVEVHVLRERGSSAAVVCFRGRAIPVSCLTRLEAEVARAGERSEAGALETRVRASMPGKVVEVRVKVGDVVDVGARLVVLEAMKMENEIRSKGRGRVIALHAAPGQAVDSGALLLELEPLAAEAATATPAKGARADG